MPGRLAVLGGPGRRAEAFAAQLEAAPKGARLTDGPELALAGALRGVGARTAGDEPPALSPTPDYREQLRRRLLAVAGVPPAPVSAPSRARRATQRRMTILVGSLAGTVALAGVGTAAQQSLPGDPLHPLKRTAENALMAVGGASVARAVVADRMDEVAALVVDHAPAPPVASALLDLDALVWRASGEAGDAGVADTRAMARRQQQRLDALMSQLPQGAVAAAQQLRGSLTLMAQATTGAPVQPLPGVPAIAPGGAVPGGSIPGGSIPGGAVPDGGLPAGVLPSGGLVPGLPGSSTGSGVAPLSSPSAAVPGASSGPDQLPLPLPSVSGLTSPSGSPLPSVSVLPLLSASVSPLPTAPSVLPSSLTSPLPGLDPLPLPLLGPLSPSPVPVATLPLSQLRGTEGTQR